MSEVVPLPSFGEVFFDERGQERVLRVTWHEGTLVLSLWRGEMCTASFRMPMSDVGRLVDTLDEGFVEAGGQYDDEVGEQPAHAEHQTYGEYPGTGQYARPRPEDYAESPRYPESPQIPQPAQYPDSAQYAEPVPRPGPSPEESRPVPVVGPNDVLVARGSAPSPDRPQDRTGPLYGSGDAVPRENMIVNDALPYGQSQPVEPMAAGSGEPAYQLPGDHYPPDRQPAPYGDRQPDPYGMTAPQQPGDRYGMTAPPQEPADRYGVAPQQPVDPFAPPVVRQQPVDPFAPHAEQFPPPAHQPRPDPYGQPAPPTSTDPYGFAAQQQQQHQQHQPGYASPQQDPYASPQDPYGGGYPAPAQPGPYAFGGQQAVPPQPPSHPAGHPPGHPADLRDLYGPQGGYQQEVDPSDPLGLFGQPAQPGPEQRMHRPYVQEPPHSTGERPRPEQRYDEQRYDEQRYDDRRRDERDDRRDW
ncbi:hypothetical protein FHS43_002933 [Streptosporangium becharense]|uniref:Uncharacterized protein n=1 Tax=Streptosporangium becharense TaxID=1816182 RepID=A0A7W9MIT0_9ACTN|nr:hypothetical protein [Streptosporangium becharense]MBB2911660.1 hypothetical protein [Streptosporangium becharense]MBB5822522.1 hypothetical protein [Streptosporangium becharense]